MIRYERICFWFNAQRFLSSVQLHCGNAVRWAAGHLDVFVARAVSFFRDSQRSASKMLADSGCICLWQMNIMPLSAAMGTRDLPTTTGVAGSIKDVVAEDG